MPVDVMKELERAGAVLTDRHFVYTSGKHGSAYVNSDPLFPDVRLVSELCEMLVAPFAGQVDTVAAPATGGIVLAVLAARAFVDRGEDVRAVWGDKADGDFIFERAGFIDQVRGKRVLVVEDLLNTGLSVDRVCRLVERTGGELVGASVIANRGSSTAASLGVPQLEALATVTMDVFDAGQCTLCTERRPIVSDIGHGASYMAHHPDHPGGFISLLNK
jgi:orotate phosphoribosyltransferase